MSFRTKNHTKCTVKCDTQYIRCPAVGNRSMQLQKLTALTITPSWINGKDEDYLGTDKERGEGVKRSEGEKRTLFLDPSPTTIHAMTATEAAANVFIARLNTTPSSFKLSVTVGQLVYLMFVFHE